MIFKLLAQNNYTEIKMLLEGGGVDLIQKNAFGNTPLHEACMINDKGNPDIVRLFLESGLEYDINAQGVDGFTPLQYAVSKRNNTIVELLLERGAQVDKPDAGGNTPLFNAVMGFVGDDQVVKTLLDNGADPGIANNHGITVSKLLDMPKNEAIRHLFDPA